MTSEQMAPVPAPVEQKLTREQQAEADKRKLFEDRLQICYALRKAQIKPDDVVPGSYEEGRLMRRLFNESIALAFRNWFEHLDEDTSARISKYLEEHSDEQIIAMEDMDPILEALEKSRHHRTLH